MIIIVSSYRSILAVQFDEGSVASMTIPQQAVLDIAGNWIANELVVEFIYRMDSKYH